MGIDIVASVTAWLDGIAAGRIDLAVDNPALARMTLALLGAEPARQPEARRAAGAPVDQLTTR
jgi:hypothetical protein